MMQIHKTFFFVLVTILFATSLSAQNQDFRIIDVLPIHDGINFNTYTQPGGTVTLSVKVYGSNLSGQWVNFRIYLSNDNSQNSFDQQVASQYVHFENNGQEKTVAVTFTMPSYACLTNGMYLIAHSSFPDFNGDNNEDYLLFDSATEDLNFRHTWNRDGGIVCVENHHEIETYSHEVGGWLRNDGCGNATNVQLTTLLIKPGTNFLAQLIDSETNAVWHYYDINANGRKYFRFHVDISADLPEGNYEICWTARTETQNELDQSNNFACKPFAFYPATACRPMADIGDTKTNTGSKRKTNILTISPNPTRGESTVDYETSSAKSIFTLADLQGRILATTCLEANEQTGKLRFDLTNHPNGIYFVRMTSEDGSEPGVVRLVKQ